MNYFIPFIIAAILSLYFVGALRRIGISKDLVSVPRNRDVHKVPIPRIGGAGIFLSFIIVAVISYFSFHLSFNSSSLFGIDNKFLGIIIGGSIITLTMLLDDIRGMKAYQKLLFQILVALIVIGSGIGIDTLSNPFGTTLNLNSIYIPIITIGSVTYHISFWSDLITLIWIVGMMNVINFIDGVDGLAGGISGIAAFTIFLLSISAFVGQPSTAMISVILAGSCLGFLYWNFPPAKIFMGDSGAMFLGFMLGVLPLISGGKLATAFLVLGFPIIDGLFVATGRLIRKENPLTTPDKTHLHHRFLSAGFSTRQSILILYGISAAFGWVALRSSTENKLIAAGILVLSLIILIQILRMKAKNK